MTKKSLLILILFISTATPILTQNSELKIKIMNGTTGRVGEADSLKVILLREAMLPIKELNNVSGSFTIGNLNLPEGVPVLLQASYKGANYNKMIPPVPELRKKETVIEVYDSTTEPGTIRTRSLIQFVKMKDILQVYKIYIVQNQSNPPKAFSSSEGLDFYIPENATNLSGTWTQGDSQMGIPLSFEEKSGNIRSIKRSVLPGTTEIQVGFSIPWESGDLLIEDRILFENPTKDNSKPVFLRPMDMELNIAGGAKPVELIEDIPEGLKAYMVGYSEGSRSITFSLSGGTPVQPRFSQEPRQIVNGSWFPEWDTAIVAVIGILALLFSFQFLGDAIFKKRNSDGK